LPWLAIDRRNRLRKHTESAAQHNKLSAHGADRFTVLHAKIRQRLEIRRQPTRQPHQFQIAICLLFEPPARLDAVQISV
jgi:hypothetical protein